MNSGKKICISISLAFLLGCQSQAPLMPAPEYELADFVLLCGDGLVYPKMSD